MLIFHVYTRKGKLTGHLGVNGAEFDRTSPLVSPLEATWRTFGLRTGWRCLDFLINERLHRLNEQTAAASFTYLRVVV
jgi:hypothetical protein